MRILVCLKQVPEPQSNLQLEGEGLAAPHAAPLAATLAGARYQLGNLDAYALENALNLATAWPDCQVEAVTVGPARAATVLERARGMGAQAAWHLLCPEDVDPPALTIATWLAAWAGPRGYDLILTGALSQDAMQGQVGPLLAGLLGLDWVSLAVNLRPGPPGCLHLERELEGGRRQELELALPALVSVQAGGPEPRYPSLSNLLRAKATPPESLDTANLPAPADGLELLGLTRPQRRRAGQVLAGTLAEQAAQLCGLLRGRGLL